MPPASSHPPPGKGGSSSLSTLLTGPRAPQASGMQQLQENPHGEGASATGTPCSAELLFRAPSQRKKKRKENKTNPTTITVAPASICRRVIQHMCFQRAGPGGDGDLALTYFLLLLEVLMSLQNPASRQEPGVRVWLHLCLTPLLTSPPWPIPAPISLDLHRVPGNGTLRPRPACEQGKSPSVRQRILGTQGGVTCSLRS